MSRGVEVAGVLITHPDRVVFPQAEEATLGVTKLDVARYVARIAPRMLPHVEGRPLSLVRCPQGQQGACFYQKHWTTTPPPGVELVEVPEESGATAPYVVVRGVQGLVSLVQHGVLEVHPWGARVESLERPDRAIFDLDPAPDVAWSTVVHTAQRLRRVLRACGLTCWVKSTGGKGLHVVVPCAPTVGWNDLHDFVRLTTTSLLAGDPDGLVDTASKAARTGKIFVDYLRNGRGATAVAPWSTRARAGAPIAVPVTWAALPTLESGADVQVATVDGWLETARRDPWSALVRSTQTLTEEVMTRLLTGPTDPARRPSRGTPTRGNPTRGTPTRRANGR